MNRDRLLDGISRGAIGSVDLLLAILHHRSCAECECRRLRVASIHRNILFPGMLQIKPACRLHLDIESLCLWQVIADNHWQVDHIADGQNFRRIMLKEERLERLNLTVGEFSDTEIDLHAIYDAEKWLAEQQGKDGDWKPQYGYDDDGLTAYIAVSLAESEQDTQDPLKKSLHESVARALTYMSDPHQNLNEPYTLAEFAIAAADFGDRQRAASAIEKLIKLGAPEHGGMYWALEHNTPFYGWGQAGRVESTAMVVLALATINLTDETRRLVDAGTLWLLHEKDRYGVWYSGQATVNVLSALLKGIDTNVYRNPDARLAAAVNGKTVSLSRDSTASPDAPTMVDISDLIQPGDNGIVVQNGSALSTASVQAVADYYVPWTGVPVTEATRPGHSDALRLAVRFDKTEARAGDIVHCSVDADRIGSLGWGMMIAEVGLPPGAEVDRRVLNDVIDKSGWAVSHYDVLPDRLVLYLWPQAGGTKLTFEFRPRYGLKARTAPSVLYDYTIPKRW